MALPDYPAAFYPVAAFAILITAISKGGFGQAPGALAVSLMAMFIAPPEAAGIMLPILCAMDLFGVYAYRHSWSRAHLRIMLPGALVGIVLGGFAFGLLPVNAIRLLLGIIAVTFTSWVSSTSGTWRPPSSSPRWHRSASGSASGCIGAFRKRRFSTQAMRCCSSPA